MGAAARLREVFWDRPVWLLLAAGIPLFLGNFFAGRAGISGWDANYYFSYAAALAEHGSLELGPTYEAMAAGGADPAAFDSAKRSAAGKVANFYPIGHSLLHAPATFAGSLAAIATEGRRTATGPTAQLAFCLSCIAAGAAGLLLMQRWLRRHFEREAVALALYALAGSTMLPYYWFILPALSHTTTLLAGGLVLELVSRIEDGAGRRLWFALGAAMGWAVSVRLQDVGVGWFAVAALVSVRAGAAAWGATVAGGVCGMLPQLLHWRWKDGSWLPPSYNDYSSFDFTNLHLGEVLFSAQHGLFLWHPALLAAFGAFALWLGRRPSAAGWGLAGQFAGIWLIGAGYSIWWFGDSFGSRPFLSVWALFWAGGCVLATWALGSRGRTVAAAGVVGVLTVWNGVLMVAFHLGWISRSGALDVGRLLGRFF